MASRRVRVVVASFDQFMTTLIVALVLDIVANLRRAASQGGTPVDTGWARANWMPRIGAPAQALVTPGTEEGRAAAASGTGAASEAGVAAVAVGYRFKLGPVYISNPVPYIVQLNAGSSTQAPANFVQAAIAEGIVSAVRRVGAR